MLNRRLWLAPILLALSYLFVLAAFFHGWTWSLFDELSWVVQFPEKSGLIEWTRNDFATYGRIRPLSAAFVFIKMRLLGVDAHALRLERAAEFLLSAGLAIAYLRRRGLPWLFVAFGAAFWLKSPPQLEQFNWITLSELNGTILVLLALLAYERSRCLSYALLLCAGLTKEPFIFMLPLPALLEKRWRESLVALAWVTLHVSFLMLSRRTYTADVAVGNMQFNALGEIARGFVIDFAAAAPLFLFFRGRFEFSDSLRRALLLFGFSALYAGAVLSKAWGYTYILSPVILLSALGFSFLLEHLSRARALSRTALLYVGLLVVAFSARVCWNVSRAYAKSSARLEIVEKLRAEPLKGAVASNCPFDTKGFGFIADARDGDSFCSRSVDTCCRKDGYFALGTRCEGFDSLSAELSRRGAHLLVANREWRLFDCR